MTMYPQSNAIIDVKTGEILKYSELLKGKRVVMPNNYPMHPQSGTLLEHDGTVIDLVELLLTSGNGGTSLWVGTQAEYDVITTKEPNTLYFIKEEVLYAVNSTDIPYEDDETSTLREE